VWHCPHLRAAARLLLTAGRVAIDRYLVPTAANPPQQRATAE